MNMKWQKRGALYFSITCIAWPKDAPPRSKYIVQKVVAGKGFCWKLWRWNEDEGQYIAVGNSGDVYSFNRLYHAQERADWLERQAGRAGVKSDPTPVDAAAAAFEAQQ